MKGVPLVRASTVIPFVRFLEPLGLPTGRLLDDVGLPAAVLERPSLLVPAHQALRLVAAAAREAGVEHIGLRVGERTPIELLGAFGKALLGSATLHDALHTAVCLHPLFASGGRLWLSTTSDQLWLHHVHDRRVEVGRSDGEEFGLALVLQLVGRATREPPPVALHLTATHARGLEDIGLLANARVRLGCDSNSVGIPRRLLGRRMPRNAGGVPSRAELERQLLALAPATDFAGSVQQAVATLMLGRYPDIHATAAAVGLTVRTLQRRLAESAQSYSQVVDQQRCNRAVALLADPGARITDIAIELGYSDLANFTHAFRRWTGVSPRAFRSKASAAWQDVTQGCVSR